MPYVLGLTGNIACGKTSVGKLLLELGAEAYIDADAVVHRLYEKDQPIARQIADTFGSRVLRPDGEVDRQILGAIVFRDPEAMKRLESIVHPAVTLAIQAELKRVSTEGIAVLDAVKLLEGGSGAFCHVKWLVVCQPEQQIQRLMQRNAMSEEEAWERIRAQPPVEPKRTLVDEVIENGGTREETRRQVVEAFERALLKFHN
ncbi:dephospho-CoA kinase [Ktedonospora formicarum]|uniref:Dephospho-CoA kinase n=1 Tax=Ktedonospora formicarum TaxID=2778364 RepID=A0A8J3HXF2_9CHLR|nr:dephospho-CoA kinase [Ktedonospora formicarum]GHO42840.1 dephospho-CoA kinase [Ktedonospora formicarum]